MTARAPRSTRPDFEIFRDLKAVGYLLIVLLRTVFKPFRRKKPSVE